MTDKPTPTDAELEALLLDKLPASKHYIRPVIEKMVAAMQAAIDKCGQPAQKTVTVVPATGDVWLKHDDDLRYVRRVLEAGRQMTDVDQRAAIDIVQGLRVTARSMAVDAKKPAQAAEPVAWLRNTTAPQPHAVTNLKYRSALDAQAGVEYIPVFAAPQPVAREPLTPEQIAEMMRDTWGCASIAPRHAPEFARAVERAHGITKGGQHVS